MSDGSAEKRASLPDLHRIARWLFGAGFLGLLAVILFTFGDYGITWDEDIQSRYGATLLRWYESGFQDQTATRFGNLYLYGGFFESLAELVSRHSPIGHFDTRHLVGALFGTASFAAVFGIGAYLSGPLAGLLGAVLLGLDPLYYGHLFANSKDSPFATSYIVAIFFIVASYRAAPGRRGLWWIPLGLAIGISAGIRVWGLALLGWLGLLWGYALVSRERRALPPDISNGLRGTAAAFAVVTTLAWVTMVAGWPWAAVAPLTRPFQALLATATLRPDMSTFFRGEFVPATALPRDYVVTWFSLTLPEAHLIGLGVALVMVGRFLWRWQRGSLLVMNRERTLIAWLSVVGVAPFLFAAVARPFLYDGIRHLLFVIPPLCALMGVGLAALFQSTVSRWLKGVVGIAVLSSSVMTVADMVELHPYQTVYFNRAVAGGLPRAVHRFEADYWGSSFKEGVEWLITNYEPPSHRPVRLALVGANRQLTYYLERLEGGRRFVARESDDDPDILLITRTQNRFKRVKGTLLHTVQRKGAPLLFIFEIRRPGAEPGLDGSSG